ncbi:MAG: hypothetical protein KDA86_19070 [Planctomycetaceae bacterium]|nr:hypothetical protein [Planctomycetaceae bacterium]
MAVRTKGRAKFEFEGHHFVWWIEDFEHLSIVSTDKLFSVKVPVVKEPGEPDILVIIGREFVGGQPE